MTLYIIIGVLIGFGLYLLFIRKNNRVNLQAIPDQHVSHSQLRNEMNHDEMDHKEMNHSNSGHNHKSGHGCCG